MPNPKGHPESLENYKFQTTRKEACTAQISVRVPPSLKAKLKDVDNWQEGVREYLQKIVEPKSA